MRNRILLISLISVSIFSVILQYNFRIEVDARTQKVESDTPFSHDLFDQILQKHVIDGRVNYSKLKENPGGFDDYLDQLAFADPTKMNYNEQLAFWINTYNALIIKGVIDHYPIKSVRKVKLFKGFFYRLKFQVAEESYTLNQIEHDIIRTEFGDPRVHFALVCASLSCPPIRNTIFHPETIEEQLEEVTQRFITNPEKVKLDKIKRTVYLSKIFKWYKEDFREGYEGVPDFLADYLPSDDAEFVLEKDIKFVFLPYDWSLNDIK